MTYQQDKTNHTHQARRLKYLALFVFAIGVLVPGIGQFLFEVTEGVIGVFILWSVGLSFTALFLLYRSRQHAALTRERDTRPPVIYLRPFSQDISGLKPAFFGQLSLFSGSLEEALRDAVAPIGPLLGLGKPGDALPPVGADRIYAGDEEWQEKVTTLMQSAQLVIILVGRGGAGLEWEIQCAFDKVERNRILLLVGDNDYDQAIESIERFSGEKLPTYQIIKRSRGPTQFFDIIEGAFLSFPREGEVRILNLRAPYLRGFGYFDAEARYALKPVFEMLGIPWAPPPIAITNVIGALAFTALVFGLLYLFAYGK